LSAMALPRAAFFEFSRVLAALISSENVGWGTRIPTRQYH
jgi:hypothetical protein